MVPGSCEVGGHSPLPACSGGSAGSTGGCPSPPLPEPILVSKVLTYSDVSTEVARTGRIVLPRIQVQQCLPDLLRLCQAEHALPAVRSGGPVKLSVDLSVEDEAGRTWVVLMKTWQNVVSGEHRPTFVLENTADFVRANRLAQGDTLAFCPLHGRMLLRTSLRANQLLPRSLKRGAGAAAAGAKRSLGTGKASPLAARTPEPPARRHKGPAPAAASAEHAVVAPPAFWQPSQVHVTEAAHALLQMHGAGSCLDSGASDCNRAWRSGSPLASTGAPAAAAAARTPEPALRSTTPPTPTLTAGFPVPASSLGPHQPVYRPKPLRHAAAAALQQHQQQQQREMCSCVPCAGPGQAAVVLAPPQTHDADLLPSPPPRNGAVFRPNGAGAGSSSLPADALLHARSWLASLLRQQEHERWLVQAYNRILLLQVLQQEHMQQQRAQQAQQHRAGFDA